MTTELTTFTPDNPIAILTDGEQFDALLGRIRAEVEAHVPDLTTKKGRDAIKSLAYKVTRTKTALDDAGKELNAGKRKEIDAVDAVRRDVREKLDALANDARKPLDEWEAAEAARQHAVSVTMDLLNAAHEFDGEYASSDIQQRIDDLNAIEFDAEIFQESLEIAVNAKGNAISELQAMLERQLQAESDAAELAELRRQKDARDEADRLAAEDAARIAAEKAAEDASIAEVFAEQERREKEAEAAEAKRLSDIAAAEQAAADAATAEAARVAQIAIDAANAEAKRLKDAEDARLAEEARITEETAAREADKAHRGAVMKAAKEAIMAAGDIDENAAKKIVLAIVASEVPNVKLSF